MPIPKEDIRNTAGMTFWDVREVEIVEWGPGSDGEGDPTEVHVVLRVEQLPEPLILRLRTRAYALELSDAIGIHTNNVWPLIPPRPSDKLIERKTYVVVDGEGKTLQDFLVATRTTGNGQRARVLIEDGYVLVEGVPETNPDYVPITGAHIRTGHRRFRVA